MKVDKGFDRLAPYYDLLKRMLFGRALAKSELWTLGFIPQGARILIVGGGTGQLLAFLPKTKISEVYFLDTSEKMLAIARKRLPVSLHTRVHFIHGDERSLSEDLRFNVLITNFFLDLFPDRKLAGIVERLGARVAEDGLWLVSEFVDGREAWQRVMLRAMYSFFRVSCGIEASSLPAWEATLGKAGFHQRASESFYGAFVKSAVFTRSEHAFFKP